MGGVSKTRLTASSAGLSRALLHHGARRSSSCCWPGPGRVTGSRDQRRLLRARSPPSRLREEPRLYVYGGRRAPLGARWSREVSREKGTRHCHAHVEHLGCCGNYIARWRGQAVPRKRVRDRHVHNYNRARLERNADNGQWELQLSRQPEQGWHHWWYQHGPRLRSRIAALRAIEGAGRFGLLLGPACSASELPFRGRGRSTERRARTARGPRVRTHISALPVRGEAHEPVGARAPDRAICALPAPAQR